MEDWQTSIYSKYGFIKTIEKELFRVINAKNLNEAQKKRLRSLEITYKTFKLKHDTAPEKITQEPQYWKIATKNKTQLLN